MPHDALHLLRDEVHALSGPDRDLDAHHFPQVGGPHAAAVYHPVGLDEALIGVHTGDAAALIPLDAVNMGVGIHLQTKLLGLLHEGKADLIRAHGRVARGPDAAHHVLGQKGLHLRQGLGVHHAHVVAVVGLALGVFGGGLVFRLGLADVEAALPVKFKVVGKPFGQLLIVADAGVPHLGVQPGGFVANQGHGVAVAGGAAGDVPPVDERHPQALFAQVIGHAGADGARADYGNVKLAHSTTPWASRPKEMGRTGGRAEEPPTWSGPTPSS
ncbi:hypothetical protein SDC9_126266 [bioreactor metagenome]|uniref:Uncharacterized protein n=1 Tax=bioreactor metagenome TaxID=1076179 RepID=A0A645CQN1_9ZZZZ